MFGFGGKEEGTFKKPYYKIFMNMFVTTDFSMVIEPLVWLQTCKDKDTELMASQLVGPAMFMANYVKKSSMYEPAKFERLEDFSTTNKNVRALISFIFLVRKFDKAKFNILAVF